MGVSGWGAWHPFSPSWVPWQARCGLRASRRIWQWYVQCWFCFPFVVVGILVGMDQKDSFVAMRSGWFCMLRCTSRCVLLGCLEAQDFCILAGMDQKDSLYARCWF